jgi:hypothetical protein
MQAHGGFLRVYDARGAYSEVRASFVRFAANSLPDK